MRFFNIGLFVTSQGGFWVFEYVLGELNFIQYFSTNLYSIFRCYGTGTGRYRAGSTGFRGQIPDEPSCSEELTAQTWQRWTPVPPIWRMALCIAVWNGYVRCIFMFIYCLLPVRSGFSAFIFDSV
jgi:hypothetical protein